MARSRGVAGFDLGLDDEDVTPPPRSRKQEESIAELLAGSRDAATKFSSSDRGRLPRAASAPFSSFSGGDPIDLLQREVMGRSGGSSSFQAPLDPDEDDEFQKEIQKSLGLTMGSSAAGDQSFFGAAGSGSSLQVPPAQQRVNSGSSLADIVGDILSDGEGRSSSKKQQATSSSSRAPPRPSRSSTPPPVPPLPPQVDEAPQSARGRDSGLPPSGATNLSTPRPTRDGSRQPIGDGQASSVGEGEPVGTGSRRRIGQQASSKADDDLIGDMLGLGGGTPPRGPSAGAARSASPGILSTHDSMESGVTPRSREAAGSFEVELLAKPKRRLGKAKAQPAQAAQDFEDFARTAPAASQSTPSWLQADKEPGGSGWRQPSKAHSEPLRTARPQEEPDDGDLDDLLQDNTSRNAPPAAAAGSAFGGSGQQPPPAAQAASGGGSDNELPEFLRNIGEPRQRRGAPRTLGSESARTSGSGSARKGLDLGFSMEEMQQSDSDKEGLFAPSGAGRGAAGPAVQQGQRGPAGLGNLLAAASAHLQGAVSGAALAAAAVEQRGTGLASAGSREAVHQASQPVGRAAATTPPQSESSHRARFQDPVASVASPSHLHQAAARTSPASGTAPGALAAAAAAMGSGLARSGAGGSSSPTEHLPSIFGSEPPLGQGQVPSMGHYGFSAQPPLTAAPSADLLSKLAYSEAKVRQLELQLEDSELRWQQRLADAKLQADKELERMELHCRKLETELDRNKEIHSADIRHLNETKGLVIAGFETEKESIRREERRKAQLDLEKVRSDHMLELEELRRKHERALAIAQQQAEMEVEGLRKAQTGEHQLARLVEQVHGSMAEVTRMSKRVETDKSLEWSMRERQLEAREKTLREMEVRLASQSREVEEQRKRVSELVRQMEDSQVEDRSALSSERERLQTEHQRLLALQQGVREADRNNKEALKHAWTQVEEERRGLQREHLRVDSELQAKRDELELQERHIRQETDRLKSLHQQTEVARQNASRRIRESEVTIANERRCLMNDLEVFEEKRRIFEEEVLRLERERKGFEEAKEGFEYEVNAVGTMAAEVKRQSDELKVLHSLSAEAHAELQSLRGHLEEERSAQGTELERLKTMQTMIEQQRLQLLQTENQLRFQSIEEPKILFPSEALALDLGPLDFGPPSEPGGKHQPFSEKGGRVAATPCRAGLPRSGMRAELQMLLQRTRESSTEMRAYLQEQSRLLLQANKLPDYPAPHGQVPPLTGQIPFFGAACPQPVREPTTAAPPSGLQGLSQMPCLAGRRSQAAGAPMPLSGGSSAESRGVDGGGTLEVLRPLSSDSGSA